MGMRKTATAFLVGASLVAIAAPAWAEGGHTHSYKILAGSLRSAIDSYAKQSGRQIIYRADQIADARSAGVSGALSDDAALDALLSKTGFVARRDASGAIALVSEGNAPPRVAAVDAGDASGPPVAPTQEGIQEIVVTAERRVSSVQKTAVSVSVREGAALRQQGRYSLQDILQDVPGVVGGLTLDTVGGKSDNAGSGITIRGLSASVLATGTNVSSVPATAVYVDNVYEGLGGAYDIGRVEVLRGPQGTLYGRSATAGVVAIHTASPELGRLGFDGSMEHGNYDLQRYTGAVNLPVGDDLAIRVAANRYSRDGYVSREGGAMATTAARAKLLYKPSDAFSVLLGAQFEDNTSHTGGTQYILTSPNTMEATSAEIGSGKTKLRQYWGEFNLDLGSVNLTWLPAWRTFQQDAALITPSPSTGSLSQADYTPKDHFLTQELRLSSPQDGKLTWQAGGFYYENWLTAFTSLTFLDSGAVSFTRSNDRHTKNAGVFGEATYRFTDDWRFTGGLRYDYTYVRNDQFYNKNTNGFPFPENPPIWSSLELTGEQATRRFNNITYKARVEHDVTRDNLLYGMVSTGFLPGDVQVATGASGNPEVMPFNAETVTSFEIGSKNRFFDRRLQVNVDAYYYRFSGYQTNGVNVSGNPQVLSFVTLSVPARMYGGELELLYKPTSNDEFQLDYAYVNAYFVDRPELFAKYAAATKFDNVVPHTINAAYTHTFDLKDGSRLAVHGDARFLSAHSNSGQFLTPDLVAQGAGEYVRVGDEVVADINATWTTSDNRFSITGYIRNLTNNRYKTNVLVQTMDPVNVKATPYDPRTYGLVVSVAM